MDTIRVYITITTCVCVQAYIFHCTDSVYIMDYLYHDDLEKDSICYLEL